MYVRTDIEVSFLSNEKLLMGLKTLATQERSLQAEFLSYLGNVDKRKLFAAEGYSSLFRFVVGELKYSESSALKRIQACRLAQRFPRVYYDLAEGRVTLSSLSKVSPYINSTNSDRLFDEISGKSVAEVEEIIVRDFPEADIRDSVRRCVAPLSVDKVSIHFTASTEFEAKLQKAKGLLSHKFPEGKLEQIFEAALDLLIEKAEPKTKPYSSTNVTKLRQSDSVSRYIPSAVKAQVYERDLGACTHVTPDGRRCNEWRFLEYDHIYPYAWGGKSEASNLRLFCREHNQLNGRKHFPKQYAAARAT